jgi:hypothetical protein
VELASDGSFVYRPDADFHGQDSFTYRADDGDEDSIATAVTITVAPVADAPVARDDGGFSISAATPLTIAASTLLANDTDADGDTLTIASVGDAVGGSVALSGGNVIFNPTAGFSGPASFTYTVSDGNGGTDAATVSLVVRPDGSTPPTTGLTLRVSEDFYGDEHAQFAVYVDGERIGGAYTVTTPHGSGYDTVTLDGDFSDAHRVEVRLLNDQYGGSPTADRNLYVDSISLNGHTFQGEAANNTAGPNLAGDAAALYNSNGSVSFGVGAVTLKVAQDAYNGNAQFVVLVDGQQVGGVQTVTALHNPDPAGTTNYQTVTVYGDFAANPDNVVVRFVNDEYGGSPTADRNLYVDSLTINGQTFQGEAAINTAGPNGADAAALFNSNGTLTFGTSEIVLKVAEDAYQGHAQFVVLVDGEQVGGVQTVTQAHDGLNYQSISVFASVDGASTVGVQFLNDLYGEGPTTDRNLYVDGITVDGVYYAGETGQNGGGNIGGPNPTDEAALYNSNGPLVFELLHA